MIYNVPVLIEPTIIKWIYTSHEHIIIREAAVIMSVTIV